MLWQLPTIMVEYPNCIGETAMNNSKLRLHIGTTIRKRREEMNMTQAELAELIDVTTGFVGQMERGESAPNLSTLKSIIDALSLEPNSLFNVGEEEKVPEGLYELYHIFLTLSEHDQKVILLVARSLRQLEDKKADEG